MGTSNPYVDGAALLLGAFQDYGSQKGQHKAVQDAIKTLSGMEDNAQQAYNSGYGIAKQGLDATQSIYGTTDDAKNALYEALMRINSVDPYKAGHFTYGKTIEDFFDPAFQLSVNNANDSINGSQALGGNLFSSNTADKIAAQNQVLASGMYKDALAAMQADKGLEQSIWAGNEEARQNEAQAAANMARTRYDVASDTAGNLNTAQKDFYNALMGLNSDLWQNKADYIGQLAQLKASDPGKAKFLGLF